MSFSLAAQAKQLLESAGYSFVKRAEDGWWIMQEGDNTVAINRSLGDLIREQANKEGAW